MTAGGSLETTEVVHQGPEAGGPSASRCRELFRTLTGGVSLVTSHGAAGPVGLTASSVIAASLEPPLLLVSIANGSSTLAAIRLSNRFAVNHLTADQRTLAGHFASSRPGWAKFSGVPVVESRPPVLAGALSAAVCDVVWEVAAGDHTLVLGHVDHVVLGGGQPLVWHASGYHALSGAGVA